MDTRVLLEAAAQAARYDVRSDASGLLYINNGASWFGDEWNPLEDDGDALRLAVRALNWPHGGRAFNNAVSTLFAVGKLPEDPGEATRLAIVMAAANLRLKEIP